MKTSIQLAFLAVILAGPYSATSRAKSNYVAHEWGTFTSIQGGDGELLPWRPLQTAELPGFVYNWNQPGLKGVVGGPTQFSKVSLVALQRMETPVIYFYPSGNLSLSVSVDFPKGIITDWFPHASQIGPVLPVGTNLNPGTLRESRAVWKNLQLVAESNGNAEVRNWLPQDKSGNHYFAARETAAGFVQTESPSGGVKETEKFIFYRGAGSFKTPLRVSVDTNNFLRVENTGGEKLAHLFLISVADNGRGKSGTIASLKDLPPSKSIQWQRLDSVDEDGQPELPLDEFQMKIATQMQAALVSEGLFEEEARAMVNTWKDSWFTEEGVRVLYLLPRAWTDETLPLTLNPKPSKLVRVMVGRAEIITPRAEAELSRSLTRAANGDESDRRRALREIGSFGRFAEPALRRASLHAASTTAVNLGYQLLARATHSDFE